MGKSELSTSAYAYFTEFVFKKNEADNLLTWCATANTSLILENFYSLLGSEKLKLTNGLVDTFNGVLLKKKYLETKTNKTLVLEVEGLITQITGVTWFGNKARGLNASDNLEGVNLGYSLCFGNTGSPNMWTLNGHKNNNQYDVLLTNTTTIDYNIVHKIRIEHRYDGRITLFLDGIQIGQITDTKHLSGYCGIYLYKQSSATITRYDYCYI